MGGQQNVVPATNLGSVINAATNQNQLALNANQLQQRNLLGGLNLGSQALFGQPLGGLVPSGGLLGSLGNMLGLGGGGGPANFGGTGLSAGDVSSLAADPNLAQAAFNAAGGTPW
jgi:hypothetical protein